MRPPGKNVKRVGGRVVEALPATTFKVLTQDQKEILAHLSGKMRLYHIKILPGDEVIIELSPDERRGRIVKRL